MSKSAREGQAQPPSAGESGALSPDEQVAQRIVEQLVTKGLIDTAQADAVWGGLAGGAARSADWRFVAETAIALEVRNATDAG